MTVGDRNRAQIVDVAARLRQDVAIADDAERPVIAHDDRAPRPRRRIDSIAVAIDVSGASVSAGPRGISVTRASRLTMLKPNTSRHLSAVGPLR